MTSAKIEDRKAWLGGPWDVVKGKNPVISKGLFKPPMDPLVDQYDKAKTEYEKVATKKKELRVILDKGLGQMGPTQTSLSQSADEGVKASKDIGAKAAKHQDDLNKYGAGDDPDTKGAYGALTALADDVAQSAAVYKTIGEKMSSTALAWAAVVKKTAADYKTAADAIDAATKKLEAQLNGLDDQIRKLAKSYTEIAIKADKEDAADSIRKFIGYMP